LFDHESNNTVDVREAGTVIRSLGYALVKEAHMIAETEEPARNV
jgi:hypothetical protein